MNGDRIITIQLVTCHTLADSTIGNAHMLLRKGILLYSHLTLINVDVIVGFTESTI